VSAVLSQFDWEEVALVYIPDTVQQVILLVFRRFADRVGRKNVVLRLSYKS
jgi:hypothetical protein